LNLGGIRLFEFGIGSHIRPDGLARSDRTGKLGKSRGGANLAVGYCLGEGAVWRMRGKLKNELHHWWPRALSKFWADHSGHAHCLSWDGELLRSLPKSFGAIRNDNNIVFKDEPTPWDESFEKTFANADSGFPGSITWLQGLTSPIAASAKPFAERLTPLAVERDRQDTLAECLASLIARSPNFRQRIRITTDYYRGRFGLPAIGADKTLIGMNVRRAQKTFSEAMRGGGKFVVLHSGAQEFVFGDGFLHNFSSADRPLAPRCLVPLTPEIAVFYVRPMKYRTFPSGFALNLMPEEVAVINRTVQIYSARFVFFREIYPIVDETFGRGEHLEATYHTYPWLDDLERTMSEAYFGNASEIGTAAEGQATPL